MKRPHFLLVSLVATIVSVHAAAMPYRPSQARSEMLINTDWTFNYLPSGVETPEMASLDFDDSRWQAISVPHTWFTYETTSDIHPFIGSAAERDDAYWWNGWGWYRKRIKFDRQLQGKKIFIEFDAVQKYAKVYVNGEFLGDHKGGYGSFYFDLTPYLRFGEDNVIAVAVSARRDDKFGTIPPATAGNFNVYGGIYRDVRLVVKNQIHIPFQGSYKHEGGTFVTTSAVESGNAVINLKTYVRNGSGASRKITLKSIVVDAAGEVVRTLVSNSIVEDGEIHCFEQKSDPIANPHLWSPEDPYLYHIYSEVYDERGCLLDNYTTPLGFRYFHWDHDAGTLVLNGRSIHIHGINRHQEYPWLGDAMPKWLTERDIMDMASNLNTNFQRTAHYPQDPIVYDMHDRLGIITVEEVPNNKNIEYDRQVQEWNMREMVRRDRNHPSIMFWSVGNETSCAADSRWTFEEDTTRIIHERKTERYGDYVTHHASDLDMENLLRVTVRGWTDTDVKDLEPKNNEAVSKSGQQAGTEEWQHSMARVQDGSIRGRIDGNIVCWLYADHGCDRIYKDAPLKNINYKGWVDMYRYPKYMYYLWQANYATDPMVYIHPHYWQRKYSGRKCTFRVDSNCDVVELFVNGSSIGKAYPSASNFHTVEFKDVEVMEGTLSAVAFRDGKEVRDEVVMAGEPYAVVLNHIQDKNLVADRSGLAVVSADVVDADGNHVQAFSGDLEWRISGPASLVGPEHYSSDIDLGLSSFGTGYVTTPVSNIVRTSDKPGLITVTVTAEGLKPGTLTLKSVKNRKKTIAGVSEIQLKDEGRTKVARDSVFFEKVEYVQEISPIFAPEQFNASSTEEYVRIIRAFVMDRNPGIDVDCIEFGFLMERLGTYLENTAGELTEDDYNFIGKSYNDLRLLSRAIDNRNFHPLYSMQLKKDLSKRVILKGELVDIEKALHQINSIPPLLDIVLVRNPSKSSQVAKVQYGNTTYRYSIVASSIEEVVELLHPGFSGLTEEERVKFLTLVAEVNPSVIYAGDGCGFRYDTPVAIPRKIR
ncbi:MAG: glycoside hydrolase family 2 protein [Candidatus Cryptobacteroides sp.]